MACHQQYPGPSAPFAKPKPPAPRFRRTGLSSVHCNPVDNNSPRTRGTQRNVSLTHRNQTPNQRCPIKNKDRAYKRRSRSLGSLMPDFGIEPIYEEIEPLYANVTHTANPYVHKPPKFLQRPCRSSSTSGGAYPASRNSQDISFHNSELCCCRGRIPIEQSSASRDASYNSHPHHCRGSKQEKEHIKNQYHQPRKRKTAVIYHAFDSNVGIGRGSRRGEIAPMGRNGGEAKPVVGCHERSLNFGNIRKNSIASFDKRRCDKISPQCSITSPSLLTEREVSSTVDQVGEGGLKFAASDLTVCDLCRQTLAGVDLKKNKGVLSIFSSKNCAGTLSSSSTNTKTRKRSTDSSKICSSGTEVQSTPLVKTFSKSLVNLANFFKGGVRNDTKKIPSKQLPEISSRNLPIRKFSVDSSDKHKVFQPPVNQYSDSDIINRSSNKISILKDIRRKRSQSIDVVSLLPPQHPLKRNLVYRNSSAESPSGSPVRSNRNLDHPGDFRPRMPHALADRPKTHSQSISRHPSRNASSPSNKENRVTRLAKAFNASEESVRTRRSIVPAYQNASLAKHPPSTKKKPNISPQKERDMFIVADYAPACNSQNYASAPFPRQSKPSSSYPNQRLTFQTENHSFKNSNPYLTSVPNSSPSSDGLSESYPSWFNSNARTSKTSSRSHFQRGWLSNGSSDPPEQGAQKYSNVELMLHSHVAHPTKYLHPSEVCPTEDKEGLVFRPRSEICGRSRQDSYNQLPHGLHIPAASPVSNVGSSHGNPNDVGLPPPQFISKNNIHCSSMTSDASCFSVGHEPFVNDNSRRLENNQTNPFIPQEKDGIYRAKYIETPKSPIESELCQSHPHEIACSSDILCSGDCKDDMHNFSRSRASSLAVNYDSDRSFKEDESNSDSSSLVSSSLNWSGNEHRNSSSDCQYMNTWRMEEMNHQRKLLNQRQHVNNSLNDGSKSHSFDIQPPPIRPRKKFLTDSDVEPSRGNSVGSYSASIMEPDEPSISNRESKVKRQIGSPSTPRRSSCLEEVGETDKVFSKVHPNPNHSQKYNYSDKVRGANLETSELPSPGPSKTIQNFADDREADKKVSSKANPTHSHISRDFDQARDAKRISRVPTNSSDSHSSHRSQGFTKSPKSPRRISQLFNFCNHSSSSSFCDSDCTADTTVLIDSRKSAYSLQSVDQTNYNKITNGSASKVSKFSTPDVIPKSPSTVSFKEIPYSEVKESGLRNTLSNPSSPTKHAFDSYDKEVKWRERKSRSTFYIDSPTLGDLKSSDSDRDRRSSSEKRVAFRARSESPSVTKSPKKRSIFSKFLNLGDRIPQEIVPASPSSYRKRYSRTMSPASSLSPKPERKSKTTPHHRDSSLSPTSKATLRKVKSGSLPNILSDQSRPRRPRSKTRRASSSSRPVPNHVLPFRHWHHGSSGTIGSWSKGVAYHLQKPDDGDGVEEGWEVVMVSEEELCKMVGDTTKKSKSKKSKLRYSRAATSVPTTNLLKHYFVTFCIILIV